MRNGSFYPYFFLTSYGNSPHHVSASVSRVWYSVPITRRLALLVLNFLVSCAGAGVSRTSRRTLWCCRGRRRWPSPCALGIGRRPRPGTPRARPLPPGRLRRTSRRLGWPPTPAQRRGARARRRLFGAPSWPRHGGRRGRGGGQPAHGGVVGADERQEARGSCGRRRLRRQRGRVGARLCSHARCGRPETRQHEFQRCSVCGSANYCSRACQALDWKRAHRGQCGAAAAAARWLAAGNAY